MKLFAAAAGVASWSLMEYVLHRFVGHGPRREVPPGVFGMVSPQGLMGRFNREHIAHHADPKYFAPTRDKALAAVFTTVVAGGAASVLLGRRSGLAYGLGLAGMYTVYEVLHRRVHTHPPTGPYGRWLRLHHLAHHHRSPKINHGVTSNLWDRVWGTETGTAKLRVPAKLAPVWMVSQGELKREYAQDYELVRKSAEPVVGL